VGRTATRAERRSRPSYTEADTREDREDLGTGVGQGGPSDRLAEAASTSRLRGPTAARWVVERTFGWLGQNRRMSKDYERLCATGEAFIYAAMTRLMVRRLARV
jgi:hypothetical protein